MTVISPLPDAIIDEPQSPRGPLWTWATGYWRQSRRPLASLAFILPLLVLYEGGVLVLGPQAVRNGVDVWLRQFLDRLGFGHYFLLPVLTVALLAAWHHTTRDLWRLKAGTLYLMAAESAVLGLALVEVARLQGHLLQAIGAADGPLAVCGVGSHGGYRWLGRLAGYFGAGIYEEVLFRLVLLPLVAGGIKLVGGGPRLCVVGSIVLTSLAFSAAHYLGPQGDAIAWFSFLFRFLAGGFFAVLFVYRGFGIAAGSHALYDIFVGLL